MYEEIIVSKGKNSSGLTLLRDSMFILNGGKATETTVSSGGSMIVSKGGKATETTVSSGGRMIVSGGKVSGTTIASSGYFIMSGGTINGLTLENASGRVSSGGGTINDLTLSGGSVALYRGTINRADGDHGNIYVYSGGKVNSATFNGGCLYVYSNCTANKITLENNAQITVVDGGKASNVTLESGATAYFYDDAVLTNVTLTGGVSDPGKDQYAGHLHAHDVTIKGLKIGFGTSIGLDEGCSATKVSWTPGDGVVNIWDASLSFTSKYSGVYLGSGGTHVSQTKELLSSSLAKGESAYVMKGGYANANELKGGMMEIWNGGTAENTLISNDGYNSSWVKVSSGGTVTSTRVSGINGYLYVNGGYAGDTIIGNDGEMQISGGSASGIQVETGGWLYISSGTATNVEWTPFVGHLYVRDGGRVTFKTALTGIYAGNNDTLLDKTEKTLQDWTVNTGSNMLYVMSGGKAENTAVLGWGSMVVFGGSASGTTLGGEKGGYMELHEEAKAIDTVVSSGGLYVYGGHAVSTTVYCGGSMGIYSGGKAENVMIASGGDLKVNNGGKAEDVTVESGYYRQGGYVYVSSGAVISNLQLDYGSILYVSSGGKVVNVNSSYGSLIQTEKGASVKKIKAVEAVSPDSDHDEKNGWADKKKKTINSYILNSEATVISSDSWPDLQFDENPMTIDSYNAYVGYTDEADFLKIHLDTAAKLSFGAYATDESKFTVWRLDGSKLKSLQASTLKLDEYEYDPDSYYFVETAGLLLDAGDYFLSMESTNAAKGGNAYYNVYYGCVFFDQGDNADDDGNLLREKLHEGDPDYEKYDVGTLDGESGYIMDDWVGYGDEIDFRRFSLDNGGANLSFSVHSDDATKFTVWKYDEKKKKLVSVQTTQVKEYKYKEVKMSASYQAMTKALLLESGEYFFSVESTNAKKGASAYYSVEVNQADSMFFAAGDDGWNNYLYDKKNKDNPLNFNVYDGSARTIDSETESVGLDDGSYEDESGTTWSNFVGFGDATDFQKIRLNSNATLSFTLTATDATKFTIWRLDEKEDKKGIVYTQKSLQATTLKKDKETGLYSADTKLLSLDTGVYYVSMESTNASKGGRAYYNVEVDSFIAEDAVASALAMPESEPALGFAETCAGSATGLLASL